MNTNTRKISQAVTTVQTARTKGRRRGGGIVEIVPALLQLQKISLEITRPPEDGNKRMRKKRGRGGRERELLKEEETWKGGLHPAR